MEKIKNCPVLTKNFSRPFLQAFSLKGEQEYKYPKDIIFKKGHLPNEDENFIYFIETGTVELYYGLDENSKWNQRINII